MIIRRRLQSAGPPCLSANGLKSFGLPLKVAPMSCDSLSYLCLIVFLIVPETATRPLALQNYLSAFSRVALRRRILPGQRENAGKASRPYLEFSGREYGSIGRKKRAETPCALPARVVRQEWRISESNQISAIRSLGYEEYIVNPTSGFTRIC
jgi:hypothetical protein